MRAKIPDLSMALEGRFDEHHALMCRLHLQPVLATGTPYHELGEDYFTTRKDPDKETQRLIAKLQTLGHKVTLEPAAA